MRSVLLTTVVIVLPVLTVADYTTQDRPGTSTYSRPSQARLDEIRRALTAQIAVRDEVEGTMRAPTAEEAAALGEPSGAAGAPVAVPGGGVALRVAGEHLSLSVATRQPDGTVRVGDSGSEGVRHVR